MNLESLTKKTSTLVRALMATVATAALSLGLVACATPGPKPTEAAQQAFEADLAKYSEADPDEIESMMGSAATDLEQMGISGSDLIQAIKGKFTYSIDSADEVSADEVKLTVTTENVDIVKVFTDWGTGAQAYAEEKVKEGNLDSEAIIKEYTQKLLDDLQASDAPMTSSTTEVTMEKDDDGNWEMTNDSVLAEVLFPGIGAA